MRHEKYPTQDQLLNDIVDIKLFEHRIVVAGSRNYSDYEEFCQLLKPEIEGLSNLLFISGMASSGADALIVRFCQENNYLYYPMPADWERFGKRAGYMRNDSMLLEATRLIAFHDGKSPGTSHMIKISLDKELPVKVFKIDLDKKSIRTINLYTIQVPQWRIANELGIKFVDITAKSGIAAFAPDMENVLLYKEGQLSEEEYTQLYKDKMFQSKSKFKNYWNTLLKYDHMAFGCYCAPNTFCHRHLFIEMAKDFLEENDISVNLCGEITKERIDIVPVTTDK